MSGYWNPKRRRFLGTAAAAAAVVPVSSCARTEASPWRTLSLQEAATAEAICERLIPADPEFPGAAWAGAVNYIDRQLAGHFRQDRKRYSEGLAEIEKLSQSVHQSGFTRITPQQQDELLQQIERGQAMISGWPGDKQRAFFRMILNHTLQSYYGDPRHGGNRDQVGYRSLGIPVTPVRGREQHDLTQIEGGGRK